MLPQCRAHAIHYALCAVGQQVLLADLVGDPDWKYDLQRGRLSLGDGVQWQAQVLGTESELSGTWLWAWANSASHIPEHLLTASRLLKAYGEHHAIPELTAPEVRLTDIDGHCLVLQRPFSETTS